MSSEKLKQSIVDLERALAYQEQARTDSVFYGAIAKAFEVSVEYAWKFFRNEAREAGFEVEAPREAIKKAGKLELIDDVELWLRFLKICKIAVHDYLGVKREEYLGAANQLLGALNTLERKLA